MAITLPCRGRDPGSIPGRGVFKNMKFKVLTVYFDDEMGETEIVFDDNYKELPPTAKMDLREDILGELDLVEKEAMNEFEKLSDRKVKDL